MSASPVSARWPVWAYPANVLTWLRLLLIGPIVVLILRGRFGWAMLGFVVASVTDGLDGWAARRFRQHSRLGEYLDPITDKLLLSSLFVVLSLAGRLPWLVTILVFTRDLCIVITGAMIFAATRFSDFRPSVWGKLNTLAQVGAVGATLLAGVSPAHWLRVAEHIGWVCVAVLTYISGIHYAFACAGRYHAAAGQRSHDAVPAASTIPGSGS